MQNTELPIQANRVPAKYIFLDVVGFTVNRTVDAQTDIVATLNSTVLMALEAYEITEEQRLLLPTGDGICIALLNVESPYDIHLNIALLIIEKLAFVEGSTPSETEFEKMRRFQVRIGIEARTDNQVIDINGRKNIAGDGINTAQRVMGLADGNQILVGPSVYENLHPWEKYYNWFRELKPLRVKHGRELRVFQYIGKWHRGLNIDEPSV